MIFCENCKDFGVIQTGTSGDDADGNAPVFEQCEDCSPGAVWVPPIGAKWHGLGGVFAGLMRGHGGRPDYALVAFDTVEAPQQWGGIALLEEGCDNPWDGEINTRELLVTQSNHPAVLAAWGNQAPHKLWHYLPSVREMMLIGAMLPEHLTKSNYWTSTQRGRYGAYVYYSTETPVVSHGSKGEFHYVLPVARVLL